MASKAKSTADNRTKNHEDDDLTIPLDSHAVGERVYTTLDPLHPRKVAFDLFEVMCHEMINTTLTSRRAALIKDMRVRIICCGVPCFCYASLLSTCT